jgi:hypothetical protein
MSEELVAQIARRFVQRRDVKAEQYGTGMWTPTRDNDGNNVGFKRSSIQDHLDGRRTFGHYLLDAESNCRLFAFDLDLEKHGEYYADWELGDQAVEAPTVINPREAFLDRKDPARPYLKYQLRMLANELANGIKELLDLDVAMTFTGAKGVHVYGFTGPVPASQAREAANLVLEHLGTWQPSRGRAFYERVGTEPGDRNVGLEVFPKQDSLDGKDLGNLMRLPLGVNRKAPKNPTFFLDTSAPMIELRPHPDPVRLLETGNPWL